MNSPARNLYVVWENMPPPGVARRGPKLAETSLAAPIKASALLMDLAGDVHVHLLQMCCDETTIQVRVVHFGSGRFQRAAAAADGTIFPRQQMPEREEKEERDMKERERDGLGRK